MKTIELCYPAIPEDKRPHWQQRKPEFNGLNIEQSIRKLCYSGMRESKIYCRFTVPPSDWDDLLSCLDSRSERTFAYVPPNTIQFCVGGFVRDVHSDAALPEDTIGFE